MRIATLTLTALSLLGSFGPANPSGGVYPVSFAENRSDSLAPLDPLLGDARTVGLGEPIHGSHFFQVARGGIIRRLVENRGFRLLAFESHWRMAFAANEYAHGDCKGDVRKALNGLQFMAWGDRATGETLKWICQFNLAHPGDQVTVLGFDIQGPFLDRKWLDEFFPEADPAQAPRIKSELASCLTFSDAPDLARYDACLAATARTRAQIASNHAEYERRTSPARVFWSEIALRSLEAVQGEIQFAKTDVKRTMESRDQGMADVFRMIRDFVGPDTRSILYAHNYHVAKENETILPQMPFRSMGGYLDSAGERYAVVGMIAYRTEVNHALFPPASFPDPAIPVSPDSVELALHQAGLETALIDPNGVFLGPGKAHDIQDLALSAHTIAARHYDALIFADHSGPLELLPN